MLRFSLTTLLIGTVVIALACAALLKPNIYFAAVFQLTMVVTALTSVLMAIVCRGDRQRMAIGFAVFVIGWQVWLSFLGDPIKLVDRIGVAIAIKQGYTAQFGSLYSIGNPYANSSGNKYPPVSQRVFEPLIFNTKLQGLMDYGSLRAIIQSLFSLAAGLLGVIVAMLVTRLETNRSLTLTKHYE